MGGGPACKECAPRPIRSEIQHLPEVFGLLRVLADRPRPTTRFLVLGSATPGLLRQTSESLAGRIAHHELRGFALDELQRTRGFDLDRLWLRGSFPASYLARDDESSMQWRIDFTQTFIERDLPVLGVGVPPAALGRFWRMLAHWHGQIWNASELARSLGVSDATTRRYLDLLAGTFLVRVLQPWHENLAKRQVKSPKVYVADSGLVHALLGCGSHADLMAHPRMGATWEGFLLGEVVERLGARREECRARELTQRLAPLR